ncbi:uncharacterized protein BO96DRAFT_352800 [Aspergillus niger CBS 101883]|uniref:uncharacterized protein n=1 Tax=Aspergillus lacticoffeatus (strain CBS 101883) TaxID=1450533 RepID=UPI000D7F9778|nr:uncharacterized protein BO96DRAFT_352800 [Aspergillus niger CBS 101883]PYH50335.1 hypothetical protein BO96DRAFT_352800 [Aspergillus niger CBS 101883]
MNHIRFYQPKIFTSRTDEICMPSNVHSETENNKKDSKAPQLPTMMHGNHPLPRKPPPTSPANEGSVSLGGKPEDISPGVKALLASTSERAEVAHLDTDAQQINTAREEHGEHISTRNKSGNSKCAPSSSTVEPQASHSEYSNFRSTSKAVEAKSAPLILACGDQQPGSPSKLGSSNLEDCRNRSCSMDLTNSPCCLNGQGTKHTSPTSEHSDTCLASERPRADMHFLENQAKSTEISGRPRRTTVEVVVPSRRRRSLMQANLAESGSDNDDPGDTDFRTESSESGEDLAPLTNPRKRVCGMRPHKRRHIRHLTSSSRGMSNPAVSHPTESTGRYPQRISSVFTATPTTRTCSSCDCTSQSISRHSSGSWSDLLSPDTCSRGRVPDAGDKIVIILNLTNLTKWSLFSRNESQQHCKAVGSGSYGRDERLKIMIIIEESESVSKSDFIKLE